MPTHVEVLPEDLKNHEFPEKLTQRFSVYHNLERVEISKENVILTGSEHAVTSASKIICVLFKSLKDWLSREQLVRMEMPTSSSIEELEELAASIVKDDSSFHLQFHKGNVILKGKSALVEAVKEAFSYYFFSLEEECSNERPVKIEKKKQRKRTEPSQQTRNEYVCPYCSSGFKSGYFKQHVRDRCIVAKRIQKSTSKREKVAEEAVMKQRSEMKCRIPQCYESDSSVVSNQCGYDASISDGNMEDSESEVLSIQSFPRSEDDESSTQYVSSDDSDDFNINIVVNKFEVFLNTRASGRKQEKHATKSTKVKHLRKIFSTCNVSSFTELLRNSSIDAIVSNLDTWKTRSSDKLLNDGTKYNYILYIIQLLKYTFDERLFRALSDDIMAAIARWGRIKSDYITGIAEERSRKHKTDVDKYEDGEMVTLTDCFLAAMKAKVKVTGLVKMTTVPALEKITKEI